MAAFEYSALDARGRTRKGLVESDGPRQARAQLREQGLTPLSLEPVRSGDAPAAGGFTARLQSLGPTDLALLTRQLATLVGAGLPVEEALSALIRQSERARVRRIVTGVRAKVLEGQTLANGLAGYPRAFPELYRATVAAGEESGHLDAVLDRLADYTESRQALGQKIQLALFYPALLTLMAIAVVIGLLVYVVPQVVQVFVDMDQALPPLTSGLIAVSDFFRAHWLAMILALVAAGVTARLALRRPMLQLRWHRAQLGLPLVGRLGRGFNAARFARTLSILSAAGVPMLKALQISGEVVSNRAMRRAIAEATERVREGSSLSRALEASRLFPPMTVQLIASGEQSGQLENMLRRAADQQERELETFINALLGLFEPVLILVMGGIVLVIVMAILMPIFELNQMVG
ncbi:MAG: type II secretion system inner membrane protein GspF [Halothiobacillaceae bacterium]